MLSSVTFFPVQTIDGDYSKLMINEGSTTPVDEALNFVMELPEWADAEKIKR